MGEDLSRKTEPPVRVERLVTASRRVRQESMKVNAEFAAIEAAPETAASTATGGHMGSAGERHDRPPVGTDHPDKPAG